MVKGFWKKISKCCCLTYNEDDETERTYVPNGNDTNNDDGDDWLPEPLPYRYKQDLIKKWVNAADPTHAPSEDPQPVPNNNNDDHDEEYDSESDYGWMPEEMLFKDKIDFIEIWLSTVDPKFIPDEDPPFIESDHSISDNQSGSNSSNEKSDTKKDYSPLASKSGSDIKIETYVDLSSGETTYYPAATTCSPNEEETFDTETNDKSQQLEDINQDLRKYLANLNKIFALYELYKKQKKKNRAKQ